MTDQLFDAAFLHVTLLEVVDHCVSEGMECDPWIGDSYLARVFAKPLRESRRIKPVVALWEVGEQAFVS
jgi:hypothetical protein